MFQITNAVLVFRIQEPDGGGVAEDGAQPGEVQPEQDVGGDQLAGGQADHRRPGDGRHQAGVPAQGRAAQGHAAQDTGDVRHVPRGPGHRGEDAGGLQGQEGGNSGCL